MSKAYGKNLVLGYYLGYTLLLLSGKYIVRLRYVLYCICSTISCVMDHHHLWHIFLTSVIHVSNILYYIHWMEDHIMVRSNLHYIRVTTNGTSTILYVTVITIVLSSVTNVLHSRILNHVQKRMLDLPSWGN